jgi:ABC-type lipoprotein release transport system permease subunit
MIFKLALRNIHGAGLRSVINVGIVTLVIIGIIWMQGMYSGWIRTAERQSREWLNGDGRYAHRDYDRYDPFSWDKSFAPVPAELQPLVAAGTAVPILISQGMLYPDGRMLSVTIRGIPADQKLLRLPTASLAEQSEYLPALIGSAMAKSARLHKGDIVTLRWRDRHGAFNAADIIISEVMQTPFTEVDQGQVWVDLIRLQQMKDAPSAATFIVVKDGSNPFLNLKDWEFQNMDFLMSDLHNIMKTERIQALVMYAILIFLAMIAIFDTQVLAVFKRRREIGTFTALGMTQNAIIRMFTVEGILYAGLASVAALILGMPLFIYFGVRGWKVPESYQSFGIEGYNDVIHFHYSPGMVLSTILIVILITALTSWIPTLRIARLKPTDALRGRMT